MFIKCEHGRNDVSTYLGNVGWSYIKHCPVTYNYFYVKTCCCLHVKYNFYKHFDRSLYVGSLDHICVQNFSLYFLRYWDLN